MAQERGCQHFNSPGMSSRPFYQSKSVAVLPSSEANLLGTQVTTTSDASSPTILLGDTAVSLSLRQSAGTVEFWLLLLTVAGSSGAGMAVISNVRAIHMALMPPQTGEEDAEGQDRLCFMMLTVASAAGPLITVSP